MYFEVLESSLTMKAKQGRTVRQGEKGFLTVYDVFCDKLINHLTIDNDNND